MQNYTGSMNIFQINGWLGRHFLKKSVQTGVNDDCEVLSKKILSHASGRNSEYQNLEFLEDS